MLNPQDQYQDAINAQRPSNDADTNPRRWYPDGILANYVNPIFGAVTRPEGGLGLGPSSNPNTFVDQSLAAIDTRSPMPGTRVDPYDPLPMLAIHDPSNIDTSEPRSLSGLKATESYEMPAGVSGSGVSALVDRATAFFASSPVAAIFLGIAGLLVFNAAILKSGAINRAGRRSGAGVAAIGTTAATGAEDTGKSVMDAANKAAGSVVEVAEGR